MKTNDLILLPDAPSGPAFLVREREEGPAEGLWLSLDAVRDHMPANTPVILLLSGKDVSQRKVFIPARSEAQARAAIPFVLEEDVAVDTNALHFALGPMGPEGRSVAFIDKSLLENRLETVKKAGLIPVKAYALPDLLNGGDDRLLLWRDRIIYSFRNGMAGEIEANMVDMVLPALIREADVESLSVIGSGCDDVLKKLADGGVEISRTSDMSDEWIVQTICQALESRKPLNLMSGSFAPRPSFAKIRQTWSRVAVLTGLVLVGIAAYLAVEGVRYERMHDEARAEMSQIFLSVFPEATRIVNPRVQMQNALQELEEGRDDSFLALSALLYEGLEAAEGVELVSISFDRDRNGLNADILYRDYAAFQMLERTILQAGGELDEGASRQEGDATLSNVVVRQ